MGAGDFSWVKDLKHLEVFKVLEWTFTFWVGIMNDNPIFPYY